LKPPTPAPITRAINVNGNLFTPITKGPVNPIDDEYDEDKEGDD